MGDDRWQDDQPPRRRDGHGPDRRQPAQHRVGEQPQGPLRVSRLPAGRGASRPQSQGQSICGELIKLSFHSLFLLYTTGPLLLLAANSQRLRKKFEAQALFYRRSVIRKI